MCTVRNESEQMCLMENQSTVCHWANDVCIVEWTHIVYIKRVLTLSCYLSFLPKVIVYYKTNVKAPTVRKVNIYRHQKKSQLNVILDL